MQVTVTATPETVNNACKSQITAYITADGAPVTGAATQFTSNNGGSFTAVTEQGNGYYKTNFTAPSFTKTTVCTVTASASKTGYINSLATADVTVEPPPAPTPTPTPTPSATSSPTATPRPISSPTPTPTSNSNATSSSNSSGTLKFRITDNLGNPLNDTDISSTAQPAGMRTLSGITNETGYAIFNNATAGPYTFSVIKEGHQQINQTINFKGQPTTFNVLMSPETAPSADNSLLIVAAIVVAVIIAVIGVVLFIKRR